MLEVCSRNWPLLDLLCVKDREVARTARLVEDIGQDVAFSFSCVGRSCHEYQLGDCAIRSGREHFHITALTIEAPDAAMEDIPRSWSTPVPATKP